MIAYWKSYNKNVYELLRLYPYNKILALAPYARAGNASKGYRYSVQKIDLNQILILFMHACAYIGSCTALVMMRSDHVYTGDETKDYLMFTYYLTTLWPGITFIITFQFRQKEFFRCLESVDALDRLFKAYHLNLNYKILYITHLFLLGLFTVAIAINTTYYFTVLHRDFWAELPVAVGFLPTFAITFTSFFYYSFFVTVGILRYKHAHEVLEKCASLTKLDDIIRIIHDVSIVHSKLHGVVRDVNRVFGVPLLANASSCFYRITFCTVFKDYLPWDRVQELVFFIILDVVYLSTVVILCTVLKHEAERTGKILVDVDVMYFDYDAAEKKVGLLLQILHEDVEFTAANLIAIDLELPFKYFSRLMMMVLFLQNLRLWNMKT